MKASLQKIVTLLLITAALFTGSKVSAQISLLRDINNGASTQGSFPSDLVVLGSYVYYSAYDGVTGTELWRSDGTALGTTQVKDINPGDGSGSPGQLVVVGSYIYFRANDGENGIELWRTDGTTAGTILVADINPGTGSGSPGSLKVINNTTLYFTANNGTSGSELWKTDVGTLSTTIVSDINPTGSSSPSYITLVSGTTVYFSADDGSTGRELWKSDGTSIGTARIKDINPTGNSSPEYLAVLSGTVYFSASDGTNGSELWSSNGTSAGTFMVSNINATGSSYPYYITAFGSYVYFTANDGAGTTGEELWRSNGTTTQIVSDVNVGASSSFPYDLIVSGSYLYFIAYTPASGNEVFRTTGLGSTQININTAASTGSNPWDLTNISGTLYFTADDGLKGYELWKYNGTTATQVDILPNAGGSSPNGYTLFGSTVYFAADNGSGTELWKISTSGSTATQVLDMIVGTGASSPSLFVYNGAGITYFRADDGSTGSEVWKTDGTLAGTTRVRDINVSGSSSPSNLVLVGSTLYFSAFDGTDTELWRSDGTLAGTVKLDINAGGSSFPSQLFALNGTTLIFSATDGTNGTELWSCVNGGSPTMVENINTTSAAASSSPFGFKIFGSFAYYSANDGVNGNELWRVSTTTPNAANNSLFSNINTAANASSSPSNFLVVSSTLYFSANNGTGSELWKTDGATVTQVKDINTTTGTASSSPYPIGAIGNTLLFAATDGTNGYELWKSDGTNVNTVMVKNINTNNSSTTNSGFSLQASSSLFSVFNSKLYFSAYEPTTGYEMWVSDGTTVGTTLFKDINPGPATGSFTYPVISGSRLYFIGSDGTGPAIFVTDGVRSCATVLVSPFSGAQTSTATLLTSIGTKMIFSMVAQGYDREPFLLDPALVTLPVDIAINTHPATQTITVGSPVTFTVAATGTGLTYQWQKNSVNIPSATSSSYTIPSVAAGDAAQYRCVVTGTCGGPLNSNQATLTVSAAQPTAQPTSITFSNLTVSSMTVSFTAAAGSPAGYIVLRKAGSSAPSETTVDGTTYTVGAALGSSTIAYVGSATSFNQTGLTASTSYSYAVFSYNGTTGTFNYLITSPLTGTASTLVAPPAAQPTSLLFSNIASESLTGTFTAATGSPAGYLVIRKQGSAPTGIPAGGTTYSIGNTIGDAKVAYVGPATTFNDDQNGLTGAQTFYYKVFSFSGSGVTTNYLTTAPLAGNQIMLAYEPPAQPTALQFTNIAASSFTVSFTAATDFPTGYLAIRKLSGSPTGVPQDKTVYIAGDAVGDGVVAYVGTGTTFNEVLVPQAYSYDVFAYNGSTGTINYKTANPLEGTLSADDTPPVISNETTTAITSPASTQLKIIATITENESSLAAGSVKAQYRSISTGAAFSAQEDMILNGSKWEFNVPATENGELGVEYKITATNSRALSSTVTSSAVLSYSDALIPYTAFGSAVSNYRIISMPLDLTSKSINDVFVDDLGASDKTNWRMFSFDNAGNKNVEMGSSSSIETGKGYWLLIKDSKNLDTGPGKTVTTSSTAPYSISLVSGWNLIGNPYNFNVLWDDVLTASGVSGLKLITYDGSYNDAGDTKLNKFEGGFVLATTPVTLKFPVTKNPSAGRELASAKSKNLNSIDQPNWEVVFTLRNGNQVRELGGIGMNENASMIEDHYDGFTLPRFMDYLELNHAKRFLSIPYSKDIVPSAQNHEWEFIVETNLIGKTELLWDNSYFGNNETTLVLWDELEKRAIDMKQFNNYSTSAKTSQPFKIFYGNKSFVQEKIALKSLLIHSVSPNPTYGQTQITFSLAGTEESRAKVRVLNLLGQPVSTVFDGMLAAGYHEVSWNGQDDLGSRPAQGVYLVEVSQGQFYEVLRLVVK